MSDRRNKTEKKHPPSLHAGLKENFGYCFFKTAAGLRRRVAEHLESEGLLPPQSAILAVLQLSPPLNQLKLGEELGIDKATMVRFIDGLEAKNLVARESSKEDRRAKLVTITRKGRELAARLERDRRRFEEEFLAPLTKKEKETLSRLIAKLNA